MFRIILIVSMLFSLTGCLTPTTLGISETDWQNYSPEQRQKIKSGYYEVLKAHPSSDEESGALADSTLSVQLAEGTAKMPPFTQAIQFKPVDFQLSNGRCRTITLESLQGNESVNVKACFLGKSLFIDPSAYEISKKVGSIRLHYSPIWDRGFTYQHISSSGYAHLEDVNVTVKVSANNAEMLQTNEHFSD